MTTSTPARIVDDFHRLYYDSFQTTWTSTFWLGVRALKCPLDLWIYQELIHELSPDLIVESGTAEGGSALFLASICELRRHGEVVSIDVADAPGRPAHPRLEYLRGSSTSEDVLARVRERAAGKRTVLAILDSDHSKANVLAELRAYAPIVTRGSYLIVEDTNVNGHPVLPSFGPGPMEAVDEFLGENQGFLVDRSREKLLLTFNPRGWLRRIE